MNVPATAVLEQDLGPGKFMCVNCGAPLSFAAEEGDSLLDQARCEYCDVVNDRALAELRKQRAAQRHEERKKEQRIRSMTWFAAATAGALLLIGIAAAIGTQRDLARDHAEVERRRAQLVNVRERQVVVIQQWGSMPPSPDRDAELSGAENRVRIERARYDEAAAAYNAQVGTPWSRFVARAFGLPTRARLSDDPHW